MIHPPKITTVVTALFTVLCICRSVVSSSVGIVDIYETHINTEDELSFKKIADREHEQLSLDEVECGIWLAPSTIQGAGLGMYAGRDFQESEEILPTGDSIVAIVDLETHALANGRSEDRFLWDEYTWNAQTLHAAGEGRHSVNIASPGLGAAANSFLPIFNVEEWYAVKDTTGLHRSLHPSAGSFSPYHNRKSTAKRFIASGQELFVSYGASWFEGRSFLGPIPLYKDLDHAQSLIDAYKSFRQKVGQDLASHIWDAFVKKTAYKKSRVIGSFHHDDSDEMHILTTTNTTLKELREQQSSRSLSWLKQHGTCGDHLAAGTSKLLPEAGRGAFATRTLPKGTVVAQLPMIHIPNRSIFEMYNFATVVDSENQDMFAPNQHSGLLGFQLLLNYCYGHEQSTLLLCPYGPLTNYVNHNQSLANVKLKWGRPESGNHMPELLSQTISVFTEDSTAKLAMEIVATRDISKGEEIFLDYGDEWEKAWQDHVSRWKPVQGAERYRSAADFNADRRSRLPSIFEQLNKTADLFPPNVELKCDLSFKNPGEWEKHYSAGTIDHFLEFHSSDFHPCVILRSQLLEDGNYFYTVHVHYGYDDNDKDGEEKNMQNIIIENIPKDALRFFDLAYTDDTFLPNAFRHDIRIPDDIFPEIWKNKEL